MFKNFFRKKASPRRPPPPEAPSVSVAPPEAPSLLEAVASNNLDVISATEALFPRQERYDAACRAIELGYPQALRAILRRNLFDLTDTSAGDKEAAKTLFRCAGKNNIALWNVLTAINDAAGTGRLSLEDLQAISQETGMTAAVKLSLRYKLVNEDILALAPISVSSDTKLTTLFNFRAQQQVLLADKGGDSGPGISAVPFRDIENPEMLDELYAVYKKMGGTAEYSSGIKKTAILKS